MFIYKEHCNSIPVQILDIYGLAELYYAHIYEGGCGWHAHWTNTFVVQKCIIIIVIISQTYYSLHLHEH